MFGVPKEVRSENPRALRDRLSFSDRDVAILRSVRNNVHRYAAHGGRFNFWLKNVGAGGVILIGPIPILLAGAPYSAVPVILAGLLTVVSVAVFLLIRSITVAT
jgi:uncharacterized membrane protein